MATRHDPAPAAVGGDSRTLGPATGGATMRISSQEAGTVDCQPLSPAPYPPDMPTDERIAVLRRELAEVSSVLHRLQRRSDSPVARIWDTVGKALPPVVLALAGWGLTIWRDVSIIQATRFSRDDAVMLEARLRDELPPAWLREGLQDLKASLKEMQADVAALPVIQVKLDRALQLAERNESAIAAMKAAEGKTK